MRWSNLNPKIAPCENRGCCFWVVLEGVASLTAAPIPVCTANKDSGFPHTCMKIYIPAVNKNDEVAHFEIQTVLLKNGNGNCFVTGLVDSAIEEMAQVAISYLRYNAELYRLHRDVFTKNDLHIHFTEGSFMKEGTSAGLGIAVSIMEELFKWKKIHVSVLVSGEIDLYGGIIGIGGVKEKTRYFSRLRKFSYFVLPESNVAKPSDMILGFNNLLQVYKWCAAVK